MDRLAQHSEEGTVATPVGDLAYRICGTGRTPVVLWPSIFTDGAIFDRVVARLADRCRFLIVDGPGHGRSGGLRREFAIADCARAMAAAMDRAGFGTAIVGGVSWGGLVGAQLAIDDPARVRSLVLMNTPMLLGAAPPSLPARLIAFGARRMLWSALYRNGVADSFFSPAALRADPAYARHFHRMLREADPVALSAAVRSVLLRGVPLAGRLGLLRVPVLLVAGREDAMYPPRQQEEAAARIADCRFALAPGRHISPVEAPQEVARLLEAFIADVEGRESGGGRPLRSGLPVQIT